MVTSRAPQQQREILASSPVPAFEQHLRRAGLNALTAGPSRVVQVNVGKLCNQRCQHCHVDAGPHQTGANMAWPTFAACLDVIARLRPQVVDITGGAPELNVHFRRFVIAVRTLGVPEIIDRCNLTVLLLAGQADLADFLAQQRIHIVASLPAVDVTQTDAQRGDGVYASSITALLLLNRLGYGREGSDLRLTLMSNPSGAFLPPAQDDAQTRFTRLLRERHGVVFNDLIELTNMPISRFLDYLIRSGNYGPYLQRLSAAFNPDTVAGLMCRSTLSIGWDGALYDCDFNQMLEMPVLAPGSTSIFTYQKALMEGRPVATGAHCLGCTAGQGSSCGGATSTTS